MTSNRQQFDIDIAQWNTTCLFSHLKNKLTHSFSFNMPASYIYESQLQHLYIFYMVQPHFQSSVSHAPDGTDGKQLKDFSATSN